MLRARPAARLTRWAAALAVALCAAACLAATPAVARTLYWSAVEVEARLDADGRLHVVERQRIVFDGAWNGGERIFRQFPGQKLELGAVRRIDPGTGAARELAEGNLDRVDEYRMVERNVLRWRSRLPTDPPFDQTELIYELDYVLSGVLQPGAGGRWIVEPELAFPDRLGPIERLRGVLELDPVWRPVGDTRLVVERANLGPGEGVTLYAELEYLAEGEPAAVPDFATTGAVALCFGLAMAALAWLFWQFFRDERELGRYGASSTPVPVDRGVVEEELLALPPEVVGAFWDRSIGPPEVAAVIARLVTEKKLSSAVVEVESRWRTRKILELELLVDREEFDEQDRGLVNKLFFDGRTRVDTDQIRDHYKSTGFSPVSQIQGHLQRRVKRLAERDKPAPRPSAWPSVALFLAIGLAIGLEMLTMSRSAGMVILVSLAVGLVAPLLFGLIFGYAYSRAVGSLVPLSLGFMIPLAVAYLGTLLLALVGATSPGRIPDFAPGLFGVAALALAAVWLGRVLFNQARGRDGRETLAARRRLAAIRRYLQRELRKQQPELEDAWLPYLLAFGLQHQIDRWFRDYGSAVGPRYDTLRTGVSGSGGSGRGWTGGGGAFGGAGATAAWGAAATGLAAGVSAPSSSGGGGGGGGGGSSGGGGGGGW